MLLVSTRHCHNTTLIYRFYIRIYLRCNVKHFTGRETQQHNDAICAAVICTCSVCRRSLQSMGRNISPRLTNPPCPPCLQDPSHRFKGDVMDLRLDIERRKRFAGKDRGRSPGGSRGPSRERSSEKSGKHHKKSKYVAFCCLAFFFF